MGRVALFTILFPPLVVLVYLIATGLLFEGIPVTGFVVWLTGVAYLLGVVPAWLTAAADWALSGKPLFARVAATMSVAAILAELLALYIGQPSFEWQIPFAGAAQLQCVLGWLAW